jgi:hypothetical protein
MAGRRGGRTLTSVQRGFGQVPSKGSARKGDRAANSVRFAQWPPRATLSRKLGAAGSQAAWAPQDPGDGRIRLACGRIDGNRGAGSSTRKRFGVWTYRTFAGNSGDESMVSIRRLRSSWPSGEPRSPNTPVATPFPTASRPISWKEGSTIERHNLCSATPTFRPP